MLSPDPDQYPGSIIDKDLAQGKIDAAIVWGPVGSYYAKRVTNVALTVIPLSRSGVKFDYEIAMGCATGARMESDRGEAHRGKSGCHYGDPARVQRSVGKRARRADRIETTGLASRARFSSDKSATTGIMASAASIVWPQLTVISRRYCCAVRLGAGAPARNLCSSVEQRRPSGGERQQGGLSSAAASRSGPRSSYQLPRDSKRRDDSHFRRRKPVGGHRTICRREP